MAEWPHNHGIPPLLYTDFTIFFSFSFLIKKKSWTVKATPKRKRETIFLLVKKRREKKKSWKMHKKMKLNNKGKKRKAEKIEQ